MNVPSNQSGVDFVALLNPAFVEAHAFVFDPIVRLDTLTVTRGVVRVCPGDVGAPDARLTDPDASKQLFFAIAAAHAARPVRDLVRFVWADPRSGVYPGLHMDSEVGDVVFLLDDPTRLSDEADLTLLMSERSRFCLPYHEDFYEYLSGVSDEIANQTRYARFSGDLLGDAARITEAVEVCRSLRYEPIAWNATSDDELDRLYTLGVRYAKAPKLFPTKPLNHVFPLKGETDGPPIFDD